MKILCVHAHFDDFEFVAAGTFERWRRQLGDGLQAKLIVCTDGRSGHHAMTRAETARTRLAEQEASPGWDTSSLNCCENRMGSHSWRPAAR